MFRPSSPILPLLVAILAPTWRNIVENLQKPNPETKTAQESSNLRKTCSKHMKNHPPDFRKSSKSDGLLFVFILFAIPIHSQKNAEPSRQTTEPSRQTTEASR
jgi:hypothetical protein